MRPLWRSRKISRSLYANFLQRRKLKNTRAMIDGREPQRADFEECFLQLVTATGMSHAASNNILVQRAFLCLDRTAQLPSPSTIKNQILKRLEYIEPRLLSFLPTDGTRVSLALDGWSASDMSGYMGVIAYFIDTKWVYHEVVIGFEHILGKHDGNTLADILARVVRYHRLEDRLYALTTDNAGNMATLFANVLIEYQKKNKKVKAISVTQDAEHIPCLAHVVQLSLGDLMGAIRIRPRNTELLKCWDDKVERHEIHEIAGKRLPYTLAKVKVSTNLYTNYVI